MGHQAVIARRVDGEMDVGRPHVADVGAVHQLADRAVHGDRVADRRHRADRIGAVALRAVEAAHPRLGRAALVLVEALAVGLPEIEVSAGNRLAAKTPHGAGDEARNAGRALRHVAAMGDFRRIGNMERPLDRARRRAGVQAVVDRVHQHAHAEHVGHQDEFLAFAGAQMTGTGEEVDRREPLGVGRLDLAHERMQVLDGGAHDLPQPRVGNGGPALADDVGEVLFGHIRHGCLPDSGDVLWSRSNVPPGGAFVQSENDAR